MATSRMRIALERRRRTAEQHRNIAQARAINREITGVVAHPVLLSKGRVVFFVDRDQAESWQWDEHRETRPQDEVGFAERSGQPTLAAFSWADGAVQRCGPGPRQRRRNPPFQLRSQMDLRYEQKRLAALIDDAAGSGEGDLRLPTPRHALQ